jgi:hypothetical protein
MMKKLRHALVLLIVNVVYVELVGGFSLGPVQNVVTDHDNVLPRSIITEVDEVRQKLVNTIDNRITRN